MGGAMSEQSPNEPEEQTIGEAAAEPPGRRRRDDGPEEHHLWEDVPGQAGEPEGDGS
jgi:hypothetical protein